MSDAPNHTRAIHPGASLRRDLEQLGRSKTVLSRLLGISRQTLHEILAEKQSITPRVALRIAKLTGTPAEKWLNMQLAYDLAVARSQCRELLKEVPMLDERW